MQILNKINWLQFVTILFVLIHCKPAVAQVRPMISGSLIYANMNEPGIKLENKTDLSLSYGILIKKERFISSFNTNRFISSVSTKDATSEKTGARMISRSRTQSDVLSVGYAFNRIVPSILLSNTQIRKKLEYKGQVIADKTKSAILFGISGAYFINKNFSVSTFYVLPNQKINLESAVGTSINIIF